MKRRFLLVFLALLLFSFGACARPNSIAGEKLYAACHIADCNVPFADYLDTFIDKATQLDQDDYGRKLVMIETYSKMLMERIRILLISQIDEEEAAYYYQDQCYILCFETDVGFTDDEIIEFKERNDWNMPYDEAKMQKVVYQDRNSNVMWVDDVKEVLAEYLGLSLEYYFISHGLEKVSESRQLYCVNVSLWDQSTYEILDDRFYLVLVDITQKNPIVACEEMGNSLDCQEKVHAFRETWINHDPAGG